MIPGVEVAGLKKGLLLHITDASGQMKHDEFDSPTQTQVSQKWCQDEGKEGNGRESERYTG
jgi:hypothetical protein